MAFAILRSCFGRVRPLPRRHQRKTKVRTPQRIFLPRAGACGWLWPPLPLRSFLGGACLTRGIDGRRRSLPPGLTKFCPPALQKGPHKEMQGADTVPVPSAYERLRSLVLRPGTQTLQNTQFGDSTTPFPTAFFFFFF